MGKLITIGGNRTMYESDGGTHRAAFRINIDKGLALTDPAPPVSITHSYKRQTSLEGDVTGWPPCSVGYELRETWELDIIKLTLQEDNT